MGLSLQPLDRTQVILRQVNDRLWEMANPEAGLSDYICECRDPACIETITLGLDQYELIRSHPTWFVIKPGHQIPQDERVVCQNNEFAVVTKPAADETAEGPGKTGLQ